MTSRITDDDISRLAALVGEASVRRGAEIAVAESCTGGGVAEAITRIAGSSAWFDRGFVTYSYDAKEEMLGVARDTLVKHGAVSEEVVREMAAGALSRSKARVCVAVTGIAGPGGAMPGKPVGLVWFAWGVRDGEIQSRVFHFKGDRLRVRRQAVAVALQGLVDLLAISEVGGLAPRAAKGRYALQLGQFERAKDAEAIASRVRALGLPCVVLAVTDPSGRSWSIVAAGMYGSPEEARAASRAVAQKLGVVGPIPVISLLGS